MDNLEPSRLFWFSVLQFSLKFFFIGHYSKVIVLYLSARFAPKSFFPIGKNKQEPMFFCVILADGQAEDQNYLPDSEQYDAVHSSLDLTSSSKSPAPQSTMGELNLSMLLPVPQGKGTDKLKPIIEFLGGDSQVRNATLLGENLPIPKDSRPTLVGTKEKSKLQVGITPLKVFSGSSTSNSNADITHTHDESSGISKTGSASGPTGYSNHISQPNNYDIATAVAKTSADMSSNISPLSNTQDLVKNFLASNFGQGLAKGLLALGTLGDSSYKNLMAQHFGSSVKPSVEPNPQTPLNTRLIENILPGLLLQSSKQDTTATGGKSLSTPVISIGNKVFALNDISSVLNTANGNKSTDSSLIMGAINGSRKHSVKQTNKEQIKKLDDKIVTLETLSDALDALTAKLSSDESSKRVRNQNHLPISPDAMYPNLQEGPQLKNQYTHYRHPHHRHHHHHHRKSPLDEDMQMLGALLSGSDVTQSDSIAKQVFSNDDEMDPNNNLEINGQMNTAELEMVQSKINNAIEMAEAVGQQNANTRENVVKIGTNSSNLQKSPSRDSGFLTLQNIFTGLIDDALKRGTINNLIQKWNASGSPFAEIAQNISSFLQNNGALNNPLNKKLIETGFHAFPLKHPTVENNQSNSKLAEGITSLNKTASIDNVLLTKAVNSIIGILSKRQNSLEGNSTNRSLYETIDTLTNFKGILLGGRISKITPQQDVIAQLGRKIVAEILKAPHNSSVQENLEIESKNRSKSGINIDQPQRPDFETIRKPFHDDDSKEKLTFSNYNTKNMSKSIQNTTLVDFMNSMSGDDNLHPLTSHNKPGAKYSKVKASDLMSAVIASLLNVKDTHEDSSVRKKPKLHHDETENERLAHVVPTDHTLGDLSETDAILEAPNDHAGERKKVTKPLHKKLNSAVPILTLPENRATNSNSTNSKHIDKLDSGDQMVTFTLETVDATPVPSVKNKEQPLTKEKTGLRSSKVPHYLNIQSATTLGKINSTSSKDTEHSFKQHQILQVPGILSDPTAGTSQVEAYSKSSDGDVLPVTLSPSSQNSAGSQTKSMTDLPLGLQMNAIGRIATDEDEDHSTVKPVDPAAALTSTSSLSSDSLGSKSAETKSFQDKPLPIVSDLFSTTDGETGGETEAIASKTAQTAADRQIKPSSPEIELPSASEIREISTSMKALLKTLRGYANKLKLEDEADDSSSGQLPVRSKTADNVNVNDKNVKEPATGINSFHLKSTRYESPQTSLSSSKYNNPYANFLQASPIQTSYVDSGGFENIQEQPSAEVNSYNWNFVPEQVHAQKLLDSNPTKSSLQPQVGAEQWNPGREAASVAEELKDLNLPSIEDDPAVQAVQHMEAEDNMLASQKRKAIQRHEQQNSTAKAKPSIKTLGVFGRNTIPKRKGKSRLRNEARVKPHKMKAAFSKKGNVKMNLRGKINEKNETSREINSMNVSYVGTHNIKITVKENGTSGNKSHGLSMGGNKSRINKLVSSGDDIPGSAGNHRRSHTHNNKIKKPEPSFKKILYHTHPNSTLREVDKRKSEPKPKRKP